MMPLKAFSAHLREGTARRQSPDIPRARSLIIESGESYAILLSVVEKMGLDDANANHVIKNAYDIIMELLRAKMLFDGFGTTGKGAHEAEVAYLTELGLGPRDVEFANELRYFRNGIMYYGKRFDRAYAEKVLAYLERMYPLLKSACEGRKT